MIPENLKYTKDHEWAKIDADTITVGITEHAQAELGDIVYLELPKVGQKLEAGSTFGVVESVKAVSDLYAPVSGEVVQINDELEGEPATINHAPYDKGWLIKLKVTDPSALDKLMSSAEYKSHVDSI